MARTDFLKPLNDLAYIIECAALNYTGELKSELSCLCQMIREGTPGYESQEIRAALPQLEVALDCCRGHDTGKGVGILTTISRELWAVVKT